VGGGTGGGGGVGGGTGGGGVGGGTGGGGGVGGGTGGGGVGGGTGGGGGDLDAGTGDGGIIGPSQVTLTISADGGTTGQIMWLDGNVACAGPGPCTLLVDAGTELTLRGVPGRFGVLTGFTGCAQPAHGLCQLTVSGSPTIVATFDRPNLAFVTSNAFPVGSFGLDGGDAINVANSICAEHAADAGLPGNFIAFLARQSPNRNPFSVLATARGWIRVDGKPAFDVLNDRTADDLLYPVVLTEGGTAVGSAEIATGLNDDGTIGNTCGNFTASGQLSIGQVAWGGDHWYAVYSGGACVVINYHLACFGTDRYVPVQVDRSISTNLVFVTSSAWRVDGGVAAADARCAAEGAALTQSDAGTFVAFLSSSSEEAFDRLGTSPRPWARTDGVIVIPDPTEFRDRTTSLDAPFSNLENTYFWVGSTSESCSDWSNSSGAVPRRGRAFDTTSEWYSFISGPNVPCSNLATRLACFQL
ncbi:MAG: hypothetical protein IT380_27515, partial [Myxococcales bacterium]|nr:hypothetical protein [Myxococcales bacterium]